MKCVQRGPGYIDDNEIMIYHRVINFTIRECFLCVFRFFAPKEIRFQVEIRLGDFSPTEQILNCLFFLIFSIEEIIESTRKIGLFFKSNIANYRKSRHRSVVLALETKTRRDFQELDPTWNQGKLRIILFRENVEFSFTIEQPRFAVISKSWNIVKFELSGNSSCNKIGPMSKLWKENDIWLRIWMKRQIFDELTHCFGRIFIIETPPVESPLAIV